jgi:hypothetical protein
VTKGINFHITKSSIIVTQCHDYIQMCLLRRTVNCYQFNDLPILVYFGQDVKFPQQHKKYDNTKLQEIRFLLATPTRATTNLPRD